MDSDEEDDTDSAAISERSSEETPFFDADINLVNIFNLPYEGVWTHTLQVFAIASVLTTMRAAVFANSELQAFYIVKFTCTVLYIIDIFLIIGSRNIDNLVIPPKSVQYPGWILLLDSLSLIPFQLMVPANMLTFLRNNGRGILELNNVLKIARIFYYHNVMHNSVGYSQLLFHLWELTIDTSLIFTISYCFCQIMHCIISDCPETITSAQEKKWLYETIGQLTGASHVNFQETKLFFAIFGIIGFTFFIIIFCMTVAYFTIALITVHEPEYVFFNKVKVITRSLSRFEVPQDVVLRSRQYLEVFWEIQHGYSFQFAKYLPITCSNEIGMDIHWFAIKHSSLFRNADFPLLRSISLFYEHTIMLPGDILFETQAFKNKMVYLVTGIIQILSIEDGETPILSFSGGTCLGEMSLFLHYKSHVIVRCKTVCTVYTFKRKHFITTVVKNFPKQYQALRKTAFQRIRAARECYLLNLKQQSRKKTRKDDRITIMWLKSTLHKLMMKDKDSLSKHQCQNIFLRDEFSEEKFKDKLFVADYLDMLVITERLELVTDTVFLKTSCPCIFQPDSIILRIWNSLITILAVISALVIPFSVLVVKISPLIHNVFVNTITVFWWLDLYVQISTAVKTPNELIANVEDIFYYRLGTFVFILDIFAAVPLEIFSCIILWEVTPKATGLLHLNRIIKVTRIASMSDGDKFDSSAIVKNYLKFLVIHSYLICFFGASSYAVFCFSVTNACSNMETSRTFKMLADDILIASQHLTGLSVKNFEADINSDYMYYAFLGLVSLFFTIYVFGCIASVHVLQNLARIYMLNTFNDISNALEINEIKDRYQYRVINYLDVQWKDNFATRLLYRVSNFYGLPTDIYRKIKEEVFRETILKVPAFSNLPLELISDFSIISQTHTLPRDEYICYAKDVLEHFYIIYKGYCQFIDKMSLVRTFVIGPSQTIGMLETLLQIPVFNSVATLTECKVLKVYYKDFQKIFLKYPAHKKKFDDALADFRNECRSQLVAPIKQIPIRIMRKNKEDEKSFCTFGYDLKVDSVEEFDYYIPFDRLQYFSFVQYLLLRYTIIPNGKFLFVWEIIRSACAILSVIIYSDNISGTCDDCWWFILATLLDTSAWVDIYIRLHVTYYNDDDLLVTHPLKTAIHYLKNAFITDLIAVFPFKILIPISYRTNRLVVYLQLNRTLQMYRFIKFCYFIERNTFKTTMVYFNYLRVFIILIVINFTLGMLLFNAVCEVDPSIPKDPDGRYESGITCTKHSWLAISKFETPLTYVRMRLYSVLLGSLLMARCGIDGYVLSSQNLMVTLPLMLVMAFVMSSHITGTLIGHFTVTDTTHIVYQSSLKTVKVFMKSFYVSANLQNQLISHYELKWTKKKGKNIHDIISNFNQSLKQDMLFDIYGVFFETVSVFGHGCMPFIRKLILELKHDVAVKNTYVCVVNDVKNDLHIVFRGSVIVIAPGGSKLATLGPGSMFGNLDDTPFARQTISLLTAGHAEILTFDTVTFHNILKQYQDSLKRYRGVTAAHVDYISGRGFSIVEKNESLHSSAAGFKKFWRSGLFYPTDSFIKCWTLLHLILVCYVEVAFTVYQIATKEYHLGFVITQYVCDAMNILNFFFTFRTAYENENGTLITDPRLVRKHFVGNRFDFFMQLIAAIPLDIFTWFMPSSIRLYLHPILRLNRVLRFYLFCKYFNNRQRKLNIDLFHVRFFYLILFSLLVLNCCTCSFYVIGCIDKDVNMRPPIQCDPKLPSSTKLKNYFLHFSINLMFISFSSDPMNHPETATLIFYYIFLINFLHLMRAAILAYIYVTLYKYYNLQIKYDQYLTKYYAYMRQYNVSTYLLGKIYDFLILLWKYHRGSPTPLLLLEAPAHLREQILNSAFAFHIDRHYIFQNCHVDFNRQVVSFLRNETYFRNDFIVFKGTVNCCMYFIHSGLVACSSTTNSLEEETKAILRKGSSFGIIPGLISKEAHSYNYRSLKTSVILTLNLESWEHLLKFYPASASLIGERLKNVDEMYTQ